MKKCFIKITALLFVLLMQVCAEGAAPLADLTESMGPLQEASRLLSAQVSVEQDTKLFFEKKPIGKTPEPQTASIGNMVIIDMTTSSFLRESLEQCDQRIIFFSKLKQRLDSFSTVSQVDLLLGEILEGSLSSIQRRRQLMLEGTLMPGTASSALEAPEGNEQKYRDWNYQSSLHARNRHHCAFELSRLLLCALPWQHVSRKTKSLLGCFGAFAHFLKTGDPSHPDAIMGAPEGMSDERMAYLKANPDKETDITHYEALFQTRARQVDVKGMHSPKRINDFIDRCGSFSPKMREQIFSKINQAFQDLPSGRKGRKTADTI